MAIITFLIKKNLIISYITRAMGPIIKPTDIEKPASAKKPANVEKSVSRKELVSMEESLVICHNY